MNILILREGDIRRACTMPEAIDAACEALRLYSAGVCDIPLRTTIAVPEGLGSSLYMFGYAAPAGRAGCEDRLELPGKREARPAVDAVDNGAARRADGRGVRPARRDVLHPSAHGRARRCGDTAARARGQPRLYDLRHRRTGTRAD